jgi:hypothetical protein
MPKSTFHALVSTFQRSAQEEKRFVDGKAGEIRNRSSGISSEPEDSIVEWYEEMGIGYVVYHGQKLAFKTSSIPEGKPVVGRRVKEVTVARGFATKIVLA